MTAGFLGGVDVAAGAGIQRLAWLAVGLALLGALLAFALFAALSAAISALAGSSLMDGLRRSMAEAVARAA